MYLSHLFFFTPPPLLRSYLSSAWPPATKSRKDSRVASERDGWGWGVGTPDVFSLTCFRMRAYDLRGCILYDRMQVS